MARIAIAAALLTALSIAACGGPEVVQVTSNVSIGQQLIDLKNAHDGKAISDGEYKKARAKIIDNAR
jgi:hypothetical protein